MSKKLNNFVVNIPMTGIFVSFFKLTDMWPLLAIKERYARTKKARHGDLIHLQL